MPCRAFAIGCLNAFLLCGWIVPVSADAQKKISTGDELPRLSYKTESTATELVTNAAKFNPFARQVRADIERILADYDIEDKATLNRFKGVLLSLHLLAGNDDAALKLIRERRELEDEAAARAWSGLFHESRIAATRRVENPKENSDAVKQAFQEIYTARLKELPWEVVRSTVKSRKIEQELSFKILYLVQVQNSIAPELEKSGMLTGDTALELIDVRLSIEIELPFKEERLAALNSLIASHDGTEVDIWKAREWTLSVEKKLAPVVVAIWDTGVDMAIFKNQQFVNRNEQINGKDDDQNGFIDDVHGIAYDLELNKDSNLLRPLGDASTGPTSMKRFGKGWFDIWMGIDSPEAVALRKHLSNLKPDEFNPFQEDLGFFKDFVHGTHVAGIVAEGNPFVRLLSARITWDARLVPAAPTVAKARKEATMYRETIEYFKANGVRVVNMSWGESPGNTEKQLAVSGAEPDATRRAVLARAVFEIKRDGLLAALESAPEILFVCGAVSGLDGGMFQDLIPSSFQLPNLISVGAVEQTGKRTSFTPLGKNVEVYANGFELESYIPGGDRLKVSGPFMASPNVANLAAKLIAVKPSLKPQEVVALIKQGAEKGGNENISLIHPRKSGELLKKQGNLGADGE